MRPFMLALAAALSVVGCGTQEFDVLIMGPNGDNQSFICPSGEQIDLPTYNITNPTLGGQAMACLGISTGGNCPSPSGSGGVDAGDVRCQAPAFNPLIGTCVEDFFACLQPVGPCQETNEVTSWDNGARVVRDPDNSSDGAYFPPGAEEACIAYTEVSQADLLPGSSVELQFLKPR